MMYGEQGYDMLKLLRASPEDAIPTVIARLRQYIPMWEKKKLRLSFHWRNIMERNYFKSLDHQR